MARERKRYPKENKRFSEENILEALCAMNLTDLNTLLDDYLADDTPANRLRKKCAESPTEFASALDNIIKKTSISVGLLKGSRGILYFTLLDERYPLSDDRLDLCIFLQERGAELDVAKLTPAQQARLDRLAEYRVEKSITERLVGETVKTDQSDQAFVKIFVQKIAKAVFGSIRKDGQGKRDELLIWSTKVLPNIKADKFSVDFVKTLRTLVSHIQGAARNQESIVKTFESRQDLTEMFAIPRAAYEELAKQLGTIREAKREAKLATWPQQQQQSHVEEEKKEPEAAASVNRRKNALQVRRKEVFPVVEPLEPPEREKGPRHTQKSPLPSAPDLDPPAYSEGAADDRPPAYSEGAADDRPPAYSFSR